jgi:hypothetical protein
MWGAAWAFANRYVASTIRKLIDGPGLEKVILSDQLTSLFRRWYYIIEEYTIRGLTQHGQASRDPGHRTSDAAYNVEPRYNRQEQAIWGRD